MRVIKPMTKTAVIMLADQAVKAHAKMLGHEVSVVDVVINNDGVFKPAAKYPSVAVMAKNLCGAFCRIIKAVVSGKLVKEYGYTTTRRKLICYRCHWYVKKSGRCRRCGCFVKAKAWLHTEKCPIGKW